MYVVRVSLVVPTVVFYICNGNVLLSQGILVATKSSYQIAHTPTAKVTAEVRNGVRRRLN
jgi:hypothetical protein